MQPTLSSNFYWPLAKQIMRDASIQDPSSLSYVPQIVSQKRFLENPTLYLIQLMIERGTKDACLEDHSRAFITGHLPAFMDTVKSTDYLKLVALDWFRGHPNGDRIYQVFISILRTDVFQTQLAQAEKSYYEGRQLLRTAKSPFAMAQAEEKLRDALDIFRQAEIEGEQSSYYSRMSKF